MNAEAESQQPQTLGAMIDELYKIRERRQVLENEDKKLKNDYDALETQIFAKLDAEETKRGSGRQASVSVGDPEVLPIVEEWDAFHNYVMETNSLYLLQRRISTAAVRELLASGETVPGIDVLKQRKLSLRKL